MSGEATPEERARARASWPVRRFALGTEPLDDTFAAMTPAERLAMVWPLTLAAWELSGRALPGHSRAETPVRVVRQADDDAD